MRSLRPFIVLLLWLVAGVAVAAPAPQVVTIGVLAFLGAERSLSEWAPTRAALERALPGHSFELIPLDIAGTRRAVANGDIDFLITNPGNYVELEAAYGVSRIATLDGGDAVASVIFTRADRADLGGLDDLKGASFMAVDRNAFGGFQVAWRELVDRRIDPFTDLRLRFSGFPMDQVVQAVGEGSADAGAVRACLLERMAAEGRIRLADFKLLHQARSPEVDCLLSSRVYPDWPFAKLAGTPPALAKQVATALLAMEPPAGQPGWTVPLDYQSVHELMRTLQIGPYAELGQPTLVQLLRRYWHWLLVVAAGLAWGAIHLWRVEHLVRLRTAELELALAERQRAEERERLQRQEMDHVSRLSILGEMAGNLAHELNQPLAAITNYADGCALRLEKGSVQRDELLDTTHRIAEQAKRAGRIIQRIRSFVRKRDSVRVPFDLSEAVREAADFFEGQARRRGVPMTLRLEEGLPPVDGDRIQVQQVVLNLLQNAVEAMDDTPPRQRALRVTTLRRPGGVAVWVEDRGCGLSAAARDKLFEPYFTTKPEGIGLGLALSRSIIEAHGGRLWADENDDRGITMKATLPAAQEKHG